MVSQGNEQTEAPSESLVLNGSNVRNRERYSILEGLQKQKIQEFKYKGKKTLNQFADNRKTEQNIFPSFSSNIDEHAMNKNPCDSRLSNYNTNSSQTNILDSM